MCVECFHIFSKMTLFRQICQRSKRALANIAEFVTRHQSNIKVEEPDDLATFTEVPVEVLDIKVRSPMFLVSVSRFAYVFALTGGTAGHARPGIDSSAIDRN